MKKIKTHNQIKEENKKIKSYKDYLKEFLERTGLKKKDFIIENKVVPISGSRIKRT